MLCYVFGLMSSLRWLSVHTVHLELFNSSSSDFILWIPLLFQLRYSQTIIKATEMNTKLYFQTFKHFCNHFIHFEIEINITIDLYMCNSIWDTSRRCYVVAIYTVDFKWLFLLVEQQPWHNCINKLFKGNYLWLLVCIMMFLSGSIYVLKDSVVNL